MIGTLLGLQWMTLRGRVVRSIRLLRQPKYLVGAVAGGAWMLFWIVRPIMKSDFRIQDVQVTRVETLATELVPAIHLLAAVFFTLILLSPWLFPFGKLGLSFREAELTMLLQAPLTRRQVVGYGLLKSLFGVVLTAFFLTLILGSGGPTALLQTFAGLLLPFVFWDLNNKWRGLFLLRQRELPGGIARVRRTVLTAALAIYLVLLVGAFVRFQLGFVSDLRGIEFEQLAAEVAATPLPLALRVLATPGWVLTAALFADGGTAFAVAALPLLLLVVVQREIVLRHPAHFEERALEHARDEEAKKSPTRRFKRLSARARTQAICPLPSRGRPEWAVLWKNLMRVSRTRLGLLVGSGMAVIAVLAALPALLGWPENVYIFLIFGGVMMIVFPTIAVGMAWNNDLRTEFLHIELLRTWPVAAERFVLAQVLAPAVVAFLVSASGATLIFAARVGIALVAARTGNATRIVLFPDGALGVSSMTGVVLVLSGVLPLCAAGAFASSAMQNLAVLFVPAWMADSGDGSKGVAAFGRRLVFGMAVFVAFAVALLPGLALVAAALFAQHLVGVPWTAWAFPFWGLLAASPLAVIGWLLVRLSAGLWRDLDPSEEILEIGT